MKFSCSTFLLLYAMIASAQLDIRYNFPRVEKEFIKQQVGSQYFEGKGENVIWNFANLIKDTNLIIEKRTNKK